jgi:hypothetical protein
MNCVQRMQAACQATAALPQSEDDIDNNRFNAVQKSSFRKSARKNLQNPTDSNQNPTVFGNRELFSRTHGAVSRNHKNVIPTFSQLDTDRAPQSICNRLGVEIHVCLMFGFYHDTRERLCS